jgi:N utilization substance protein A
MTAPELERQIERAMEGFMEIEGMTEEVAQQLVEQGYLSYDDLSVIEPDALMEMGGWSQEQVDAIVEQADAKAEDQEIAEEERKYQEKLEKERRATEELDKKEGRSVPPPQSLPENLAEDAVDLDVFPAVEPLKDPPSEGNLKDGEHEIPPAVEPSKGPPSEGEQQTGGNA